MGFGVMKSNVWQYSDDLVENITTKTIRPLPLIIHGGKLAVTYGEQSVLVYNSGLLVRLTVRQ